MRHQKQPLLPAPSPPLGTILLATQSTQAWQYRSSMDTQGPRRGHTPGLTSLRVQADTLPASPCKSLPYGTSAARALCWESPLVTNACGARCMCRGLP